MKAFVTTVALLAVASFAFGAPRFKDADAWRQDFRKAVSESGAAFLNPQAHPVQARRLIDLQNRADKLFGGPMDPTFGSCVKASSAYMAAWDVQRGNLNGASNASLSGQTSLAYEAGISYWDCRLAIDALEATKK